MSHPADPANDEEDYQSSEDSDFAPESAQAAAAQSASSDSESEDDNTAQDGAVKKPKKVSKRKRAQEAEDLGFENSGDEAIIEKGLKKGKRRKGKGKESRVDVIEDEDEGGTGGFVKTRAMKAAALPEQRKIHIPSGETTIDVDALWESMKHAPLIPPKPKPSTETPSQPITTSTDPTTAPQAPPKPNEPESEAESDIITVTRKYNFAGQVQTETKRVSRYSAEGKLYLASQDNPPAEPSVIPSSTTTSTSPTHALRRPLVRHSRFEPPPPLETLPPRTDLRFKTSTYIAPAINDMSKVSSKDAKKLTIVEKSAMDWAVFVDKEDIAEDLDRARKGKGTYLDNQAFLGRVGARSEEEGRRARLGAVVSKGVGV